MASGQKKVILRPFDGPPAAGYLPASGLIHAGAIYLMDPHGRVNSHQISNIKHIAYVKDFNLADQLDPERLGRRSFPTRPRGEGLWVRLTFRDGDTLEGLTDSSLTLLDSILEDAGIFLTPPEARSNTQRLFVPRAALTALQMLGTITTATRKPSPRPGPEPQPGLFGES